MARRRFLALVAATAMSAGGLAACGGSGGSSNSPAAVQSALQATANQPGLELTGSIQGSASAFGGQGSSSLTPAQKQAILDSTLVAQVSAGNGTNLSNANNAGTMSLTLRQGGNTLAEARVVGRTLYARVDIQQLTAAYGLDKGKVAQFRSRLSQLGSQVAGLNALNNGQWVSVDVNLLNQLVQTTGVTLPSAPQLVGRLAAAFFTALARSNHITSQSGGKAQITVGAQPLVTSLAQALAAVPGMSSFGSQISGLADRAKAAVPANATGNVTVTTGGGIVTNLNLPLNQFQMKQPLKGPVSVNMAVAKAGAVSAPSGATAINIPQFIHALEGSAASNS